jgi:hypothetical protein
MLTHQELLRTLGTVLDQAGATTATLTVAPDQVTVELPSSPLPIPCGAAVLQGESATQRGWRQPGVHSPFLPDRGVRRGLRVLGGALDSQPIEAYIVTINPHAIAVRPGDGQEPLLTYPV